MWFDCGIRLRFHGDVLNLNTHIHTAMAKAQPSTVTQRPLSGRGLGTHPRTDSGAFLSQSAVSVSCAIQVSLHTFLVTSLACILRGGIAESKVGMLYIFTHCCQTDFQKVPTYRIPISWRSGHCFCLFMLSGQKMGLTFLKLLWGRTTSHVIFTFGKLFVALSATNLDILQGLKASLRNLYGGFLLQAGELMRVGFRDLDLKGGGNREKWYDKWKNPGKLCANTKKQA